MRYRNALAILFVAFIVAMPSEIATGPVLLFLGGILLALLPYGITKETLKRVLLVLAMLVPLLFPDFLPYTALAIYWLFLERFDRPYLLVVLPGLLSVFATDDRYAILSFGLMVLAICLGVLERAYWQATLEAQSDVDAERSERLKLELEQEQWQQIAQQEKKLATLAERNRIARELHDTIGHVLSSALLQVTALKTLKDEEKRDAMVGDIQQTLKTGMEQTRQSVHGLYDTSLRFAEELDAQVRRFTFCPVTVRIDIAREPAAALREVLLKASAEAFTNVLRHSNATEVTIELMEHPGFYRWRFTDNGTPLHDREESGHHLGLTTMARRVERLQGRLQIKQENGFVLTIVLPKAEPLKETSTHE